MSRAEVLMPESALTSEDIRTLTADPVCRAISPASINIGTRFNNSLVRQWSPCALDRALNQIKLNHDIVQSQCVPTESLNSKRRNLLQPNLNERFEKLKQVSNTYKDYLVDSINTKLRPNQKRVTMTAASPRSSLCAVSSAGSSSMREKSPNSQGKYVVSNRRFVNSPTVLISPSNRSRGSRMESEWTRKSTRQLPGKKGEEGIQVTLENYFSNNPLTRQNFHRAGTIDKEIGCLTRVLKHQPLSISDRDSLISLFQSRHRALGNSILIPTRCLKRNVSILPTT